MEKIKAFLKKNKKAILTVIGGVIVVSLAGIVIYRYKYTNATVVETLIDGAEEAVNVIV